MSSIIIKGMQMPKECRWCPFAKTYGRKIICLATGKLLVEGTTPLKPRYVEKFCPLVELPEKHGRLVDVDALIAKCGDWYTEEGTEEGFIGTLEMLLKDAPTVVEAEGEE